MGGFIFEYLQKIWSRRRDFRYYKIMDNFKRYLIRIPNNASVVLVKKTLFVLGPLGINSFKVPTKLSFFSNNNNENFLYVTRKPFSKISFNEKKTDEIVSMNVDHCY